MIPYNTYHVGCSTTLHPTHPHTSTHTDVTFKFTYITPPTEDSTLSYDDVVVTTDDSQQTLDYDPSDVTEDVDGECGVKSEGGVKSDCGEGDGKCEDTQKSKGDLKPIAGKKRQKKVSACIYIIHSHQSIAV